MTVGFEVIGQYIITGTKIVNTISSKNTLCDDFESDVYFICIFYNISRTKRLYSRGPGFDYQRECWPWRLRLFLWFSSVHRKKFWDSTLEIRPRPLPFKFVILNSHNIRNYINWLITRLGNLQESTCLVQISNSFVHFNHCGVLCSAVHNFVPRVTYFVTQLTTRHVYLGNKMATCSFRCR
jgi:hypothetical protein